MKGKLCFFKKIIATYFASAFFVQTRYFNRIKMPRNKDIAANLALRIAGFRIHVSGINKGKFLFRKEFQLSDR